MTLIKNEEISVEGINCEIVRENERTYSVKTEMGSGIVSKEPLEFVGALRITHEARSGRSYTGLIVRTRK